VINSKHVLLNGQKKEKLNWGMDWDMDWFLFEELQHPSDHSCVGYVRFRKFH
jgi:hypothetical protein